MLSVTTLILIRLLFHRVFKMKYLSLTIVQLLKRQQVTLVEIMAGAVISSIDGETPRIMIGAVVQII